jgi:hypothetical protein
MLFAITAKAQLNLVPNPSFEEYYHIPDGTSQIYECKNWFSATGGGASPDYYSRLSIYNGISIPQNIWGYEDAKDGDFYIGIFTFQRIALYATEYVECKLTQPLLSKRYCVEFYISPADSASVYALNNIGLYFSPDSIYVDTLRRLTEFTPQFVNTNNPLTNRNGWTKVSGSFVAQGGEQYLTIGNFNLSEDDDTIRITGYSEGWGPSSSAYIYIDSVSVTLCDAVGVEETISIKPSIYPNPASNFVSISLPLNHINSRLSIYNLTGQLVAQKPITSTQIPIAELGNGMYIFVITADDKVLSRQRVVVAR